MSDAPVLMIIFNRPDHSAQVFEAIRRARPRRLFIAADGPRDSVLTDLERCKQTRELVLKVDWECDVRTLFQEKNLGCRLGVIAAITWFFEQVELGIILEDDCLPNQSFFRYCAELLNLYKDDERIFSINGSNLGYKLYGNSYSYSTFMNMWGWATWRRVAEKIDYDLVFLRKIKFRKIWLAKRLLKLSSHEIDYNWITYWDERLSWIFDGLDTWDYQWIFNQLRYDMLSIVPATNLVKNIGFGENATHTHNPDYPCAAIDTEDMIFPLQHPTTIQEDLGYLNEIVKNKWSGHTKESLLRIIKREFKTLRA